jgi:hypothetical protein
MSQPQISELYTQPTPEVDDGEEWQFVEIEPEPAPQPFVGTQQVEWSTTLPAEGIQNPQVCKPTLATRALECFVVASAKHLYHNYVQDQETRDRAFLDAAARRGLK